jgi:hypothetical protein
MKRSEINRSIAQSVEFFRTMGFRLPRWALWAPGDWNGKGELVQEIVQCGLGWDITDFGSGDFEKVGLINFNLRNGVVNRTRKAYCEKAIIVKENQLTPLHTHRSKIEDIINRSGGNLVIELQNSDESLTLSDDPLVVKIDGIPAKVPKGGQVILEPGDSICLEPGMFHLFYGEHGKGWVLVSEISSVNDDRTDNVFVDNRPRFPDIVEDESPLHLLVNDYPRYL